jgi:hypothetical protein
MQPDALIDSLASPLALQALLSPDGPATGRI